MRTIISRFMVWSVVLFGMTTIQFVHGQVLTCGGAGDNPESVIKVGEQKLMWIICAADSAAIRYHYADSMLFGQDRLPGRCQWTNEGVMPRESTAFESFQIRPMETL